jgi:hypothetical protein
MPSVFIVRFGEVRYKSAISGFRRVADAICVLLGCYAANSANSLPTFRDNSVLDRWVAPKRRLGISTVRCVTTQKSADLGVKVCTRWSGSFLGFMKTGAHKTVLFLWG